jgi:hypothetical protein
MLDRLRFRRSTTDSFNANKSAKHASFIQYVLYHISHTAPVAGAGISFIKDSQSVQTSVYVD